MEEKQGITGSTLKLIALISMLIDHIGATVVEAYIINQGYSLQLTDFSSIQPVVLLYHCLRLIGRLAFPIFVILLVEGLQHTHSKWKYLMRMLIFAIISEIPFDIAFKLSKTDILSGKIVEFSSQNVFFTLAIGLSVIIGMKMLDESEVQIFGSLILKCLVGGCGMLLAEYLHTDYGAWGILAIIVAYTFKAQKEISAIMVGIVLLLNHWMEIAAFPVVFLMRAYNGKRGWNMKWLFYIFYPVHLLLLGLLCMLVNLK